MHAVKNDTQVYYWACLSLSLSFTCSGLNKAHTFNIEPSFALTHLYKMDTCEETLKAFFASNWNELLNRNFDVLFKFILSLRTFFGDSKIIQMFLHDTSDDKRREKLEITERKVERERERKVVFGFVCVCVSVWLCAWVHECMCVSERERESVCVWYLKSRT